MTVVDSPAKKVSYGDLIGGRRFDIRITASGSGRGIESGGGNSGQGSKELQNRGNVGAARRSAAEIYWRVYVLDRCECARDAPWPRDSSPSGGAKPVAVDEKSIAEIPGIVRVVREGNFLGVVATRSGARSRQSKALKVIWSDPSEISRRAARRIFAYLKNTKSYDDQIVVNDRNLDAAFASAGKTFAATYRWPFQMHGMLGPSCAVADVGADQATIWTGTQASFRTRKEVAKLLRRPEKSVRIVYVEGAGCYGGFVRTTSRKTRPYMSRAVGKPVRVQWTRADEHAWEPKGPPQLLIVRAGVDAAENITAWEFEDRSIPWTAAPDHPNLGFAANRNHAAGVRARPAPAPAWCREFPVAAICITSRTGRSHRRLSPGCKI